MTWLIQLYFAVVVVALSLITTVRGGAASNPLKPASTAELTRKPILGLHEV